MIPTLLLVTASDLVACGVFLSVARSLLTRGVKSEDRAALRAFALWWGAMGSYMLLRAALTAHAAIGTPSVAVFLVARAAAAPILTIAVWGLVFHILYLYTGDDRVGRWLALLYAPVGAALLAAGFLPVPQAVTVDAWHVALEGEGETPLFRVVYAVIGASIVLAALAYLSLLPRLTAALQRRRVALVGSSILLWVTSGLGAFLSANDLAKFLALVGLGLLAAGGAYAAYLGPPPRPRTASATMPFEERLRALV